MIVRIEMELIEAMHLVAAFSPDSENKSLGTIQRGEAVLDKIAEQVDNIITVLEGQVKQNAHIPLCQNIEEGDEL